MCGYVILAFLIPPRLHGTPFHAAHYLQGISVLPLNIQHTLDAHFSVVQRLTHQIAEACTSLGIVRLLYLYFAVLHPLISRFQKTRCMGT